MQSTIQPYISALRRPNHLENPVVEVERLLREMLNIIGKRMVMFRYGLQPGDEAKQIPFHEIMRVRPNENPLEVFNTRNSLSFKPQERNRTFQRASTPEQTMFYGSLSDHPTKNSIPNRMTSTMEGIPWLRDPHSVGKQKVTYSKWIINGDIGLCPVIFNKEYAGNRHVATNLDRSVKAIKQNNPEFADDILLFYEFIASEFAKMHVDSADINYLVSSIYTKIVLERVAGHYDGILYPSCRMHGEGTNVAILPDSTEKLDLIVAGECMVYKNGEHVIIDNITISESDGKTPLMNFRYVPVPNSEIRGERRIYEELGVSSLDFK